ncbi:unnamed protein product [Clonostachys chloroleuca]|uniref:C2H2-type domain-containing protein n=1 Tax=Clonostachys chloroleuca TaxID=1926264 RepID=A0AA35Q9Y4_9HYPO|nr:unnamed protein product [Clonostachys chloroleuca]
MLVANSSPLFASLYTPTPYGLVDVTLSLFQLLAVLVATIMLCPRKLWQIRSQVCGRIGSLRHAFQYLLEKVFWKKVHEGKARDVTPKSSSSLKIWPLLFCVLESAKDPTWIILTVQSFSDRVDYWVSGAIIQQVGGSIRSRPTAGAGSVSSGVRKSRAGTGGRTNKANGRRKSSDRSRKGGGGGGGKHPRKWGRLRFNLPPDGPNRRNWACPFHKYDRVRYHSCATVTLSRIPDVWQHIVRTHVLSLNDFCHICFADFESSSQLADHQSLQNCVQIPGPEHLRQQDVSYLDSILRAPSGLPTDEAKWYRIWTHVFPGWEFPESPYAEGAVELAMNVINMPQPQIRFARVVQHYIFLGHPGHDAFLNTVQPEMEQAAYPQVVTSFGANQPGVPHPGPHATNIGPGVHDQEAGFLDLQNPNDSDFDDFNEEED